MQPTQLNGSQSLAYCIDTARAKHWRCPSTLSQLALDSMEEVGLAYTRFPALRVANPPTIGVQFEATTASEDLLITRPSLSTPREMRGGLPNLYHPTLHLVPSPRGSCSLHRSRMGPIGCGQPGHTFISIENCRDMEGPCSSHPPSLAWELPDRAYRTPVTYWSCNGKMIMEVPFVAGSGPNTNMAKLACPVTQILASGPTASSSGSILLLSPRKGMRGEGRRIWNRMQKSRQRVLLCRMHAPSPLEEIGRSGKGEGNRSIHILRSSEKSGLIRFYPKSFSDRDAGTGGFPQSASQAGKTQILLRIREITTLHLREHPRWRVPSIPSPRYAQERYNLSFLLVHGAGRGKQDLILAEILPSVLCPIYDA
eukprot:Gb_31172 [translate_table: standard]